MKKLINWNNFDRSEYRKKALNAKSLESFFNYLICAERIDDSDYFSVYALNDDYLQKLLSLLLSEKRTQLLENLSDFVDEKFTEVYDKQFEIDSDQAYEDYRNNGYREVV
jgi:hypothetical protein